MTDQQYIKIGEFSDYIKSALENNEFFKNVAVKGEIANLTHNKSGHIYFSLKDDASKIDCAMWKSNAHKFLSLNILEGMEVIAYGSISYYKPSGKITFVVNDIKVDGVGALAIEYEKRLRELQDRGWTDDINKKPIPKIPTNVGIVTAATGDAVRDLISNIKRRYKLVNIFLFPALVQGDEAAKDISSKINFANKFKPALDVLIVGRGGGSYEDLWAFNEWPVLEAIYNSQVPIITGIGHEPDTTLADYVADKRASTPTAAGEYATPEMSAIIKSLHNNQIQIANALQNKLTIQKSKFSHAASELKNSFSTKFTSNVTNFKSVVVNFDYTIKNKFYKIKEGIVEAKNNLHTALTNKLSHYQNLLKNINDNLELLNPVKPLQKGFSILKQNNKIIRNVGQVDLQQSITAIVSDGQIDMNVTKVNREESKNGK